MKLKLFIALLFVCLKASASDVVVLQSEQAGSLRLTEEALMATHLKVEGHIDARDFATLKKVTISRTRILDLSDAVIEAYKGKIGCYVYVTSSHFVSNTPEIEYLANELPATAFSEVRDNSLSKRIAGSTTLRRLILPKNLLNINPKAFDGCQNLSELETVEGSELRSVDNAIVYTKDKKRLVRVAPAYCGKLDVLSTVESIDSCALKDVTLSGLVFHSSVMPTIKGASLIKTAYIQSDNLVEECKQMFPNTDCFSEIQTKMVKNNEQEGILAALGEMGCKRDEVRSVVVTGTLSENDLKDLFALPNLYYADLSNASTTASKLDLYQTNLCQVKMPRGNYYLSLRYNDYLTGELVIPEGVNGLAYFENKHTSVICPSTLATLSEDAFDNCPIREVDFSACSNLQVMESVFNGCPQLESMILPPSLEYLSGISNAPIKQIDFPDNIQTLDACYECDVEEIVLPASLKELGSGSFCKMPHLVSIDASKATSWTTVEGEIFDECPFVETVDFSNCPLKRFYGFDGGTDSVPQTRVVAMGGTKYPAPTVANKLRSVKLPSTLERIDGFRNSPKLTEVALDHCPRLQHIDGFENCTQLEKLSIPYSLTNFNLTLKGCENLKTIRCAALQPPVVTSSLDNEKMAQITLCVPVGRKGVYYMSQGWDACKEVVETGYSVMVAATNGVVNGGGFYDIGTPVTLTAVPYLENELQYANVQGWYIDEEWHEGDTLTFVPTSNCKVLPVYMLSAPDFSLAPISFNLEAKNDTIHNIRLGLRGAAKIYDENGVLLQVNAEGYREYALQLHKGVQKFGITGDLYQVDLNEYNQCNTTVLTDLKIKDKEILYLIAPYLGLQEIDLIACPNLRYISLSGNGLHDINLRGCPKLTDLNLPDNNLQEIDLSGSPALTDLNLYNNNLQEIDLSGSPALTDLNLCGNSLREIDLSGSSALTYLDLSVNSLQEIDLSGCSALTRLYLSNNSLQEIDLSGCSALTRLYLSNNSLQEIDLSGCSALTDLNLSNNNLQEIDLSGCSALTELDLSVNSLQEIDLSGCPALTGLDLSVNGLQEIDLSGCPALTRLVLDNNSLQKLYLNGLSSLERLFCSSNKLKELAVENCPQIKYLDVRNNELRQWQEVPENLQWFHWDENPMAFSCLTPQLYESLIQSQQFSNDYKTAYTFKVMNDVVDENGVLDLSYELNGNAYSSQTEIVLTGSAEKLSDGKYLLSEGPWYNLIITNSNFPQLIFTSGFKLSELTGIDAMMKDDLKICITDGVVNVSGLSDNVEVSLVHSNGMLLDKVHTSQGEAVLHAKGSKGICILHLKNGTNEQKIKVRVN